jgi:hypothetical protein
MKHPSDLAYPWVDPATGEVVLDTVTSKGRSLAGRHRARAVTRSMADLDRIRHGAIGPGAADLPDSDAIYMTSTDAEHNRVVVTVDRRSERLVRALARRYGSQAVAVRVTGERPHTMPAGRNDDGTLWTGGGSVISLITAAGTGGCTTGIPWQINGVSAMLTAGHCAPDSKGAYVRTPVGLIGIVFATDGSTWKTGTGTVALPGQTTLLGDLSLIKMGYDLDGDGDKENSGYYINRGAGINSGVNANEPAIINGYATMGVGQSYCSGGSRTGELCGWVVQDTSMDWTYSDGTVVRNASWARKTSGACQNPGDSGGPVYSVNSNGTVKVRGVLSGGSIGGSGSSSSPCNLVYSDLLLAIYAWGGEAKYLNS